MRWRVITFGVMIVLTIGLVGAYLLLPRILSAQLPVLLTRVMDKPVDIGEISLSLFSLRADATRLVVGPPEAPALLAEISEQQATRHRSKHNG